MQFHMWAHTVCAVADGIAMLLSRRAKLKNENPPLLSPITALSHSRPTAGSECVFVYHLLLHPWLSLLSQSVLIIPPLTLPLLVLVQLPYLLLIISSFFCVSSTCVCFTECLFTHVSACSVQSPCHLPSLTVQPPIRALTPTYRELIIVAASSFLLNSC